MTEFVRDAVREVLSDGAFHSHRDLYGQVALRVDAKPDWRDVAAAAHEVGVTAGYVIRNGPYDRDR